VSALANATDEVGRRESRSVALVTGKYFEHRRGVSCRFGASRGTVTPLYPVCEDFG
jgi:hypothetical protein